MNKKTSAISWTESIWHTKSSHNFFNEIYTAYAFYFFCFYEFPKFKLYSASFPDFYIVLFGFPCPPQKKKSSIPNPSTAPNQKPLCFRHPYNRVLHQSPGKLFQSWKLVTWNENREAENQNQWVFACIDIFQMIQMYGILITYIY